MSTSMRCAVAAILSAALFGASGGRAHHSFAVHFLPDEIVTISGVVTEFRFRNPHGVISLNVTDEHGKQQAWEVETNSPNILKRRGWSASSIEPGEQITVEGYPARDGSNYLRIYRITFPDGRQLIGQRPSPGAGDEP